MSQSLNNRFFFGNTSFAPLTLDRAVILDKPIRDEKLIALSKSQIEAQHHTAREIAKSTLVGAQIVANEISHQTTILETAINNVSNNISAIGDQISDAILDIGNSICAELIEIRWQMIQQNEKLDQIIDILRNRRNTDAQELVRQGLRHYINDELKEAEERFKEALKSDTTDYQVLMNLGFIEVHNNNAEKAMNLFTKALKLPETLDSPSKARTLRAIARLYYTQENYDEAFLFANQASQKDDIADPEDIFMLGVYGALAGKHDVALQNIEQAILINPSYFSKASAYPDLKNIRKEIHELLGHLSIEAKSKALKLYEEAKDKVISSVIRANEAVKDADGSIQSINNFQNYFSEIKKVMEENNYSEFINVPLKIKDVISSCDEYLNNLRQHIKHKINEYNSKISSVIQDAKTTAKNKELSITKLLIFLGVIIAIVPAFKGCTAVGHYSNAIMMSALERQVAAPYLKSIFLQLSDPIVFILILVAGGLIGTVVAKILSEALFKGGHPKDVNNLKDKKDNFENQLRMITDLQSNVKQLYDHLRIPLKLTSRSGGY